MSVTNGLLIFIALIQIGNVLLLAKYLVRKKPGPKPKSKRRVFEKAAPEPAPPPRKRHRARTYEEIEME